MFEKLPDDVGQALAGRRAGMEKIVLSQLQTQHELPRLEVTSPAFLFNGLLPRRCTADGEGVSPPFGWSKCPAQAASLAIIVEDADAPTSQPLVHAIVVGLPRDISYLPEGTLNGSTSGADVRIGLNSYFRHAWLPPDPPPGHGEHRYVFQVFALQSGQPFSGSVGRSEFIRVVRQRAIAMGHLIGLYERRAQSPLIVEGEQAYSTPEK